MSEAPPYHAVSHSVPYLLSLMADLSLCWSLAVNLLMSSFPCTHVERRGGLRAQPCHQIYITADGNADLILTHSPCWYLWAWGSEPNISKWFFFFLCIFPLTETSAYVEIICRLCSNFYVLTKKTDIYRCFRVCLFGFFVCCFDFVLCWNPL